MEQNVQVIAKRIWHVMRVAYFMLRKNICKRKLLLNLKYLTMKRSHKLVSKNLAGKLIHRHCDAYEFSCSNTPNIYPQYKFSLNKKHSKPVNCEITESEMHAVNRVLEMLVNNSGKIDNVEASPFPAYSPILPGFGFGRSPMVRQLRVTDSPYMFDEMEMCDYDHAVDDAAEEFIQKFYRQLRQQKITGA